VLKVGGDVDSWCGKCKLMLTHTIEAMVGNKPMRVQCNTCKGQHGYRPTKPGEAPRRIREREERSTTRPKPQTRRGSHYEGLLESKDMALARPYSPMDKYNPGDVVEHAKFGVGIAKALKDETKIEVLFKDGPRVLIHGR
jgi:hypothetical protein